MRTEGAEVGRQTGQTIDYERKEKPHRWTLPDQEGEEITGFRETGEDVENKKKGPNSGRLFSKNGEKNLRR